MAQSNAEIIRRYVADAIAAEQGFETQLRSFAAEGDDDEVRAAFAVHAEETRLQHERLTARLTELGDDPSSVKSAAAQVFSFAPRLAQLGHIQEEKTLQNLVAAYTVEAAECAMYEALIEAARAAGDITTVQLARSIQAEEHKTADKLWHFIPSRSIIAYNMLTLSEVDPSVETKIGEASWTS